MKRITFLGLYFTFVLLGGLFLPSSLNAFNVTYLNPGYVASSADFPVPAINFGAHAIAFDDAGNLYTVDTAEFGTGQLYILKIEAATDYSTLSPYMKYSGYGITGLDFYGSEVLFFAEINKDRDSGLIGKIDTKSQTLIDSLPLPSYRPTGIGVDAGGEVYFPGRLDSMPSFGHIYESDFSEADPFIFWSDFAGTGIAVDAFGHVLASTHNGDVSPLVSNSIYILDPDSQTAGLIATFDSAIEELAFDSEGRLYVLNQTEPGEVSEIIQMDLILLCKGDFDTDGDVDLSDLAVFAADFGRTDCGTGDTCEGDFDEDDDVDGSDLARFAAEFGRTDCPFCIDNDNDGYGEGPGCKGPDCDDENPDIHPQAMDTPDDDFIDSNCDDIDGDANKAVFVSQWYGYDGNSGFDKNNSVRTLQRGIDIASGSGREYVLVDRGEYAGVALRSDVSIYGGYFVTSPGPDTHWARADYHETDIYISEELPIPVPVIGTSVSNIALDHLIIKSTSGCSNCESRYALFLRYCENISIHKSTLSSGRGADGSPGARGNNGANGGSGSAGSPGCEDSTWPCGSCSRPQGGAGGSSTCGRDGGDGGRAGHGDSRGYWGEEGAGGTPGGMGGLNDNTWTCNGHNESDGESGANGANGYPGTPGDSFGTMTYSGYSASHGKSPGTNGSHGNGGGGGGGGRGGTVLCDSYGSSGGGGGAGGCGGSGGAPGLGGGGSFAIWLHNSNDISISDSTISTSDGGRGGSGGLGGIGGSGGSGGAGGAYGGSGEQDDGGCGGYGGNGGDGGDGGRGGAAGGGPSIGIASHNSTFVQSGNIFDIGQGGSGGSIGLSALIYEE